MEGRGEFKGAAGKKCLGEVRKPEGLRYLFYTKGWRRDTHSRPFGVKKVFPTMVFTPKTPQNGRS